MEYRIQVELQRDEDAQFENAETLRIATTIESGKDAAERLFIILENLLQLVSR